MMLLHVYVTKLLQLLNPFAGRLSVIFFLLNLSNSAGKQIVAAAEFWLEARKSSAVV